MLHIKCSKTQSVAHLIGAKMSVFILYNIFNCFLSPNKKLSVTETTEQDI